MSKKQIFPNNTLTGTQIKELSLSMMETIKNEKFESNSTENILKFTKEVVKKYPRYNILLKNVPPLFSNILKKRITIDDIHILNIICDNFESIQNKNELTKKSDMVFMELHNKIGHVFPKDNKKKE